MEDLEKKAFTYVDKIFSKIIDLYRTYPWPELKNALAQIYIAGATDALASQWRSVLDEMPEVDRDFLVSSKFEEFGVAWLATLRNGTCKWYSNDDTLSLDDIRFWMPIPEPPKNESV